MLGDVLPEQTKNAVAYSVYRERRLIRVDPWRGKEHLPMTHLTRLAATPRWRQPEVFELNFLHQVIIYFYGKH